MRLPRTREGRGLPKGRGLLWSLQRAGRHSCLPFLLLVIRDPLTWGRAWRICLPHVLAPQPHPLSLADSKSPHPRTPHVPPVMSGEMSPGQGKVSGEKGPHFNFFLSCGHTGSSSILSSYL